MNNSVKHISLTLTSVVLFSFLSACNSNNSELKESRQKAIQEIEAITASATFHRDAVLKTTYIVKKADYNFDLIVKTAEYISMVPYETETLIRIAELAAKAKKECPGLFDLVELTVVGVGQSNEVIQLAKAHVQEPDPSDQKAIEERVAQLRSQAEYGSIEEALQNINQNHE